MYIASLPRATTKSGKPCPGCLVLQKYGTSAFFDTRDILKLSCHSNVDETLTYLEVGPTPTAMLSSSSNNSYSTVSMPDYYTLRYQRSLYLLFHQVHTMVAISTTNDDRPMRQLLKNTA